MKNDMKDGLDRREFLKRLGAGTAALAAISLAGCRSKGGGAATISQGGDMPAGEMTCRVNPKTGERVSIMGYGCMRWPTDENGDIDQEQVNRLVDFAIAHGVNYFDTSPAYCKGMSERATGIALSRHPRDKWVVATKLSNGMLDFLLSEREAGRIGNLGFSYHGDIAVFDRLLAEHDKYKWDFVQIQLNYVDWRHGRELDPRSNDAEYLYGELQKRGIPAIIMEPLLGGRLSNVHDHIAAELRERRNDRSVASWAFRFAASPEGVLTVLSGMTYMEHLRDNLATYSPLEPLSEEESEFLKRMAQALLRYPTIPCNDCKYCMPCPYGLDIPGILLHYNKCVNEGRLPSSSGDENYRRARREFLIGYDRSVPRLRQADHCIGCKECVRHCPQRIDIPAQMRRIDRFVEDLKQGREF